MARFAILAVALLTLVGATTTRGEDSDEVKKLKSRVELLEKQLKLSEKENELLKREVEQLKAGPSTAKKGDSTKKSSLSERLTEGTTVTGTYMYPNFPGEVAPPP